jgi:colanic acid/amylovoran biosynthesis protein
MKDYILLTNVYTYSNKGDAAIVISLLREIRRVFNKEILIQTTDILNDKDKYNTPVSSTLLWILLSSQRDKNLIIRLFVLLYGIAALKITLILSLIGIKTKIFLGKELKSYFTEVENADLVIACGGGYIRTQDSGLQNTILLYVTCLNFLCGYYLGKKVYLYSQSIGPVHGSLQRSIVKFALNRVEIVEPRETISLDYVKELSLTSQVSETADAALLLGDYGEVKDNFKYLEQYKFKVGLTVRKWFKSQEQFDHYIQSVASSVDYLIEKYDADVFYIPQVIAAKFGDDDRNAAKKLQEKVKNKDRFKLIEEDLTVSEIIGVCGMMDMFIGTRMHSNIFALINHVPVVAIEYEYKTRGIMIGLGLEEMIIDIHDISYEILKEKIDILYPKLEEYSNRIKTNLPSQTLKSQRAIEIISENYAKENN